MRAEIESLKGTYCPLWRKDCSKVCGTCKWFIRVRGRNPNTGQDVDAYDCSLAWLPIMQIETTQAARSGAAATETFRNEMSRQNEAGRIVPLGLIEAYQGMALSAHQPKLLNGTVEDVT